MAAASLQGCCPCRGVADVSAPPRLSDCVGTGAGVGSTSSASARRLLDSGVVRSRSSSSIAACFSSRDSDATAAAAAAAAAVSPLDRGQRQLGQGSLHRRALTCAACSSNSSSSISRSDSTFVPYEDRDYPNMEDTETEDEARRRNWIERGWAPWEEILSPEGQFALESIKEGVEFPEVSKETHENLVPKIWAEKQRRLLEEAEKKAAEDDEKQDTSIEGTVFDQTLVFNLIPPRDWPPPGWQVDPDELAYIRQAHALAAVPVTPHDIENNLEPEGAEIATPRWNMFLRQYADWFATNKDRLDAEALEVDPEYYPGRRRTGEHYIGDWMYELPFVYPGQHWWGKITAVNLYEGAFVCIGCVHDVWIPIRDNDWYHVRNHIKVGMHVHVEILAKRDPYRYRFPIEARLVEPNIDSLIFKRFKFPPIMIRPGDISVDDLARETLRPFWPERRPEEGSEDEPDVLVHPYVPKVWQIHVSEQMILDHEEMGETAKDGDEDDDDDEEDDEKWLGWEVVQVGPKDMDMRGPNGETEWMDYGADEDSIPTLKLVTEDSEMELDAARAERKEVNDLEDQLGDDFEMPRLRRERRMDELNRMHNQRYQEETDALIRDKACRLEFGLPLEEPGRYASSDAFGKNQYDPHDKAWQADSWFSPSASRDGARREKQPRALLREEDTAVEDDEHEEEAWHREVGFVEVEEDFEAEEGDGGVKPGKGRGKANGVGAVNGIATLRIEDFGNAVDWKVQDDDDDLGPEDGDDETTV